MPAFYQYSNAIYGSQSTTGSGQAIDYSSYPSGTWQYSGSRTSFVVKENNRNNRDFDGDRPANMISSNNQIGQGNAQTTQINGVDHQVSWDYTFRVMDPATGQTWDIGVIDVDRNNDDDVGSQGDSGYYLVFTNGAPPKGVTLQVVGVVEDEIHRPHQGTVVCFAAGTLIETQQGARAIETLTPGDMVLTRDGGYQPLRWIGKTRVPAQDQFAPIVIDPGVLGNDAELVVSPQHAVLLDDWRAQLLYGDEAVLVRAVDLLGQKGVRRRRGGFVTYLHILFDAHHLVKASGTWSESLYPGDMTRQTVNPQARAEIEALFPDLKEFGPKTARCLRAFEARCLAA